MKLARILDEKGRITLAMQKEDGELVRCEGPSLCVPSALEITRKPVRPLRFLPPVDPPALICVGANYRKHIEECRLSEQQDPVFFMKNPSAICGHLEPIVIPRICGNEVDYEGELAVIIGTDCLNATRESAPTFIAGYSVANDVSARIWQLERGGGQWIRGKSFDTFAPTGPYLVTPDEAGDPGHLAIRTRLNGETVQESSTACMIHPVFDLIAFLSQGTTLKAGTVLLTGTPEGVGWFRSPRKLLQPGDQVQIEIERIGTLCNPVKAEPSPA